MFDVICNKLPFTYYINILLIGLNLSSPFSGQEIYRGAVRRSTNFF